MNKGPFQSIKQDDMTRPEDNAAVASGQVSGCPQEAQSNTEKSQKTFQTV